MISQVNTELQDNKKSENNSIQASYDLDDKDTRYKLAMIRMIRTRDTTRTMERDDKWSPADLKCRDWE